jgi:hypothetical protein
MSANEQSNRCFWTARIICGLAMNSFPTFRKMMEIAWYYWTIEEGDSEAVNINLTPEQEKIVQHQMKAGHFRSVEE